MPDPDTSDSSIYPSGTTTKNLSTAQYGMQNPYAATVLGRGMALANTPYQGFRLPAGVTPDSARIANIDPMEANAYKGLASMNWQNPMNTGMGMVGQTGNQWSASTASPYMNAYNAMVGQDPMLNKATAGIGSMNFQNPMNQGLGATSSVIGSSFNNRGVAQNYMSPYQQQVVEQQKQNAIQDWQRQQPEQQAKGFQAGAGRGSRSALLQAESQRNLQNQLGDIQAKGSQSAYENAQNQYNAEMNRKLSAGQQSFGMGTDIYGRQYDAGTAALNRRTDAYNRSMDQYSADMNRMMNTGKSMWDMGSDLYNRNVAAGSAMRGYNQDELNAMYQDFQDERDYPQKQNQAMMALLAQMPQYQDYSSSQYTTPAPVNQGAQNAAGIAGLINDYMKSYGGGSSDGSSSGGLGDMISKGWNTVKGWFGGNK